MSLTLGIFTSEGIVLAADSRQTYRNIAGSARIGSDSATKIFQVGSSVGVTVAGPAFLTDPKQANLGQRGIGSYINEFLNQMTPKETVGTITNKLSKYLDEIYTPKTLLESAKQSLIQQILLQGGKVIKEELVPAGNVYLVDFVDKDGKPQRGAADIMPISLIVAGYDHVGDSVSLNAYIANIPGEIKHIREQGTPNQYGANWTGQTDVITRIIKGYDPRIEALEFIQSTQKTSTPEKVFNQLNGLEYIVNWGAMNLLDAIDFARLMIETTTSIQRYSDGIKLMPGDLPGVGGPVDIAVILPKEGFRWNQKKRAQLLDPKEMT